MKTEIYYFSGTGNSLFVAQKICENIEDSELISIPNVVNRKTGINGEVIGIVCPIYMYNIPHIVADFIRKIERAEYIFLVFSGAGGLGYGIKNTLNVFASKKLTLSSVFNLPMPSNYTPFGITPEEKQKKLFANIDNKVEDIIKIVKKRGRFIDSTNTSFFNTHIHPGIRYRMGYSRINIMDKSFTADDKCNGCSICQKVCPVDNITMEDNKPVWNNRCQQCYACIQWCPTESIQAGKKTVGIKRYHNPNITVNDIIRSSSEGKNC
ncbi:EFR1 family ferrodoxin [Candidatus Latescibacterota bacterium]